MNGERAASFLRVVPDDMQHRVHPSSAAKSVKLVANLACVASSPSHIERGATDMDKEGCGGVEQASDVRHLLHFSSSSAVTSTTRARQSDGQPVDLTGYAETNLKAVSKKEKKKTFTISVRRRANKHVLLQYF